MVVYNVKQLNTLVKKNTMLNHKKLACLEKFTLDIIQYKIQGDIVECGVWMGGSVALIANVLLQHKDERILRLFDSFNDPHEPLPVDGKFLIEELGGINRAHGRLEPISGYYKKVTKGVGPGNAKHVYNLLANVIKYPKEKIKIYKGWFQNTIASYSERIEKISLLIIDCDLYEPTKLCLEYLCNKVVPGGIVFVDDYYALDGCKKAVDDYLASINGKLRQVSNAGAVYWVKE